jgi:hypothetical protein
MSVISSASLAIEVSKTTRPLEERIVNLTYNANGGFTSFCYGDVAVLHNFALLFNHYGMEESWSDCKKFRVIVRTMRRSNDWRWVKMEHIEIILEAISVLYSCYDQTIDAFKRYNHFTLEAFEDACSKGQITEEEYRRHANGSKLYYDLITQNDIKEWMRTRSELFKKIKDEGKQFTISIIKSGNDDIMMILPA